MTGALLIMLGSIWTNSCAFRPGEQEGAWFNMCFTCTNTSTHIRDKETQGGPNLAYEAVCLEFLQYAAKHGHAAAQHTLGMIHYQRILRPEEGDRQLAELMASAGRRKVATRMLSIRLGLLCRDGDGVAKDIEQARELVQQCAAKRRTRRC